MKRLGFLLVAVLLATVLAGVADTPPASAMIFGAAPRLVLFGDSIPWQQCSGPVQQFSPDAGGWFIDRDGGCHGWSGATVADIAFEVQGGRFLSNGPGQPHPYFPNRGMSNVWSLREAMDRAQAWVVGLGTNDANRRSDCAGTDQTPWPIQISRPAADGGDTVPCKLTDAQFRDHIAFYMWLAAGRPVYWYDVGVTNSEDPAYPHQDEINAQLWLASTRYPNLHILPWHLAVTEHPEFVRDGVHLSPAGSAERWSLLREALAGCGVDTQ